MTLFWSMAVGVILIGLIYVAMAAWFERRKK